MFKIILLAVLVSVVWSIATATYILDGNSGFRILGDSKLESFHGPLYQTHVDDDYGVDNPGIIIPQIQDQGFQYIPESISSLPRIIGESSGFRIPDTRGRSFRNNIFHQNNQNKQTNQKHKITQQQIEVKVVNDNYNQPQRNNQGTNTNYQTDRKIPSGGNLFQGFNIGNDYSGNYGQTDLSQKVNQNSQYVSNIQSNVQDFIQQKFINVGLNQNNEPKLGNRDNVQDFIQQKFINVGLNQNNEPKLGNRDNVQDFIQQKFINVGLNQNNEPKLGNRDNVQTYTKVEQVNIDDNKNNQEQKSNQQSSNDKNIRLNNNYNSPRYELQNNEKVYPVLLSEGPLEQSEYIKLHGGNIAGYTEIPNNFGSAGHIYRQLGITEGIQYQQDLNSNVAIRLDHNTPILIANNFQGSLNDHDGILIRLRDDDENIKTLLGDSIAFSNLGNDTAYSKDINSETNGQNNYNFNVQQKTVEVGIKSVTEQSNIYNNDDNSNTEYKSTDTPTYSDSIKTDLPLNLEQKSVNVPLKDDTRQISYGSDKNQQVSSKKNSDSLNYQGNTAITLEQKPIESSSKTNYDANALQYTDPKNKNSGGEPQQKSVDVAFKSDDEQSEYKNIGGRGSEYPGIGSIDAPKYPNSNTENSVPKLEQKPVENGNYKEVKSNINVSSKAITGVFYESKSDSDIKTSGLNDYNKDTSAPSYQTPHLENQAKLRDSNIRKYPTATGGLSTSYFNADHPVSRNTENYKSRDNNLGYPSSGNNIRYGYMSNNNPIGSRGNVPRQQTESYFGSGKPNFGTNANYPRFTPSGPLNQRYSEPIYQRPISYTPQGYFGNSGPKPPLSGINNRFSHQQNSYNRDSRAPFYSGVQRIPHASSVPRYHESVSPQRYSDTPDIYNNEKFVKVSREYPQQSLTRNENPYQTSIKSQVGIRKPNIGSTVFYQSQNYQPPNSRYPASVLGSSSNSRQNIYSPGSSTTYLKRENTEPSKTGINYDSDSSGSLSIPGGVDYANGIGGIEYPGIGESSQSVVSRSKPYSTPEDTKRIATEQKPYATEEDTVKEVKSENTYPSQEEYKGIGEIGSIPTAKSDIVGGRYPVRKPLKSASVKTKSTPSGVKGKSEIKTEQKYLPITAVLSDTKKEKLDSKRTKKQYDAPIKTVTETPEKIEQQDLLYEAFLAGEGPQSIARGSSGYGFTRPSVLSSGSGGDPYKDENLPPMPYEFGFDIKDDEHGAEQYRREKMDNSGFLTGSYGFRDAEGIFREVEYEASKEGFKVNSIKTNEPGTDNENPADVVFQVQKHS